MGRGARAKRIVGAIGAVELAQRLEERRPEIEAAVLARVYSVSNPRTVGDPEYEVGLKETITAVVDYALAGVAREAEPSIPPQSIAQARHAARGGVPLDTVLRRYLTGYTLLGDFLLDEAGADPQGAELKGVLRSISGLFDELVLAVTEAYRNERQSRLRSSQQRRVEHVKRLLAGEPLDVTELGYRFEAWHLGVIASGPAGPETLRELASALDRHLLLVCPSEGTAWAWLGGRREVRAEEALSLARQSAPSGTALSMGEAAEGVDGWRLSHRQAAAALPIARRGRVALVRYADVALLASIQKDEVLVESLRRLYLLPLAQGRDDGAALRKTLRAYFDAGRNISSAASALGMSRKTVSSRLRAIEKRLGRRLDLCAPEVDAALRLEELK